MSSDEDPEARIRELERSLNDQAKASELGGSQSSSGAAYLPPPVSGYSQPDYSGQNYGTPPYTAPQYGSQPYETQQPYGTQQYGGAPFGTQFPAPRRRSWGGIPWVVFAMIAVVLAAIAAGVVVFTTKMSHVSGGGIINLPSVPSFPSTPAGPSAPAAPNAPAAPGAPDSEVITASPDTPASVSGIDSTKTINCTDGTVTISGIRNTVNITGHCVRVAVSGMNNNVTVDNADAIGASGFDNRVTFHSGSPQIDNAGSNVVEQG